MPVREDFYQLRTNTIQPSVVVQTPIFIGTASRLVSVTTKNGSFSLAIDDLEDGLSFDSTLSEASLSYWKKTGDYYVTTVNTSRKTLTCTTITQNENIEIGTNQYSCFVLDTDTNTVIFTTSLSSATFSITDPSVKNVLTLITAQAIPATINITNSRYKVCITQVKTYTSIADDFYYSAPTLTFDPISIYLFSASNVNGAIQIDWNLYYNVIDFRYLTVNATDTIPDWLVSNKNNKLGLALKNHQKISPTSAALMSMPNDTEYSIDKVLKIISQTYSYSQLGYYIVPLDLGSPTSSVIATDSSTPILFSSYVREQEASQQYYTTFLPIPLDLNIASIVHTEEAIYTTIVQTVAVGPTSNTLDHYHETVQLNAIATRYDGSTENVITQCTWTSNNSGVSVGLNTGLVRAVSMDHAETAIISATFPGLEPVSVTVHSLYYVLESIVITPAATHINYSDTQVFTVTGYWNNYDSLNITNQCTWTSSNTGIVTINSAGIATMIGFGVVTITATAPNGMSISTTLSNIAHRISIAITPSSVSLSNYGSTQQLVVTARYNDGSTNSVTNLCTWSYDSSYITIDSTGLVTAIALDVPNDLTITATLGTDLASIACHSTYSLSSIAVTPSASTIGVGTTAAFTATGTWSNNSVRDISHICAWISTNTNVATVNSSGLVTIIGAGNTTIRATASNGIIGSTALEGSSTTLRVSASSTIYAYQNTHQFMAILDNGTTQTDVTNLCTWTSSDSSHVSINSTGMALAVRLNSTATITIAATYQGHAGTSSCSTAYTITSIAVTPANSTAATGVSTQFTATGSWSGIHKNITNSSAWTSSDTLVATINNSGLASPILAGSSATITATAGGISGSTLLNVAVNPVVSVVITAPATILNYYEDTIQLRAFFEGADVTSVCTWSSNNTTKINVDINGLVKATSYQATNQTAGITASYLGHHGIMNIDSNYSITLITLSPINRTMNTGYTQAYTATASWGSHSKNITSICTWASSATNIATINSSGVATSVAYGTSTISATLDGASGYTSLTIANVVPVISAITINTVSGDLTAYLNQIQFAVRATYDTGGDAGDVTSLCTWTTSNTAIATINSNGLATAIALSASEDITITATYTSN